MNFGKHLISIKFAGLGTGNIMDVAGVMRPLSIQKWTEMYDGRSFMHRDIDRILKNNGDRSDRWSGDVDVCLFMCNRGHCYWSN